MTDEVFPVGVPPMPEVAYACGTPYGSAPPAKGAVHRWRDPPFDCRASRAIDVLQIGPGRTEVLALSLARPSNVDVELEIANPCVSFDSCDRQFERHTTLPPQLHSVF